MYIGLHVKYRLFLLDFHETWIFSTDWQPSYSMRTDRHNEASRNFAKAPQNLNVWPVSTADQLRVWQDCVDPECKYADQRR